MRIIPKSGRMVGTAATGEEAPWVVDGSGWWRPAWRPCWWPAARGGAGAGATGAGGAGGGGGRGGPGAAGTGERGRLRVVATTTQVADLAANVGGDRVRVTSLLKPGIDPHDYEPSPADIDAIAHADLVLENGVGLEAWLSDTIDSSGFDGPVVDTSQGVRLRMVGGAPDPHIWQDPGNAERMAANIERALADAQSPAARARTSHPVGRPTRRAPPPGAPPPSPSGPTWPPTPRTSPPSTPSSSGRSTAWPTARWSETK